MCLHWTHLVYIKQSAVLVYTQMLPKWGFTELSGTESWSWVSSVRLNNILCITWDGDVTSDHYYDNDSRRISSWLVLNRSERRLNRNLSIVQKQTQWKGIGCARPKHTIIKPLWAFSHEYLHCKLLKSKPWSNSHSFILMWNRSRLS